MEIIVIYCKILRDTYIYCVDKFLLHVNSYWLKYFIIQQIHIYIIRIIIKF